MTTKPRRPDLLRAVRLAAVRRSGHIINVTSESVHLRMPMLWMYAGTKTGLEFVSDLWSRELESAASG